MFCNSIYGVSLYHESNVNSNKKNACVGVDMFGRNDV